MAGTGEVEDVIYEGHGPGGVAMLCEIMTDNRNRTAPEIRKSSTRGVASWAPPIASRGCSSGKGCSSFRPAKSKRKG
jgi:transcriptional/translational regulatory protein YebC/TACO1